VQIVYDDGMGMVGEIRVVVRQDGLVIVGPEAQHAARPTAPVATGA
jgi:hypothetical protein